MLFLFFLLTSSANGYLHTYTDLKLTRTLGLISWSEAVGRRLDYANFLREEPHYVACMFKATLLQFLAVLADLNSRIRYVIIQRNAKQLVTSSRDGDARTEVTNVMCLEERRFRQVTSQK